MNVQLDLFFLLYLMYVHNADINITYNALMSSINHTTICFELHACIFSRPQLSERGDSVMQRSKFFG